MSSTSSYGLPCPPKQTFANVHQVANTIEARILQIQARKTAIVKEAFRGASGSKGTSDPDSIENLKIMFGDD